MTDILCADMVAFGKDLAALGKALQKPNTRIDKLNALALRCNMALRFSLEALPPSPAYPPADPHLPPTVTDNEPEPVDG